MIFWSSFHPRRKPSASRTRVASRSKPSRCHRILWRRPHPGHPDVGESYQATSFFISASFGDASKRYRCAVYQPMTLPCRQLCGPMGQGWASLEKRCTAGKGQLCVASTLPSPDYFVRATTTYTQPADFLFSRIYYANFSLLSSE